MATVQKTAPKYRHGQVVWLIDAVNPDLPWSICGIDHVQNEQRAKTLAAPLGSVVYLIENGKGKQSKCLSQN